MRILIVDNHDSFVYNILGEIRLAIAEGLAPDCRVEVVRCEDAPARLAEESQLRELNACQPEASGDIPDAGGFDGVILSPGPGLPSELPALQSVISKCVADHVPMLGICLGHQAIAEAFGGRLSQLRHPRHGHAEALMIVDDEDILLSGHGEEIPAEEGADRPVVGRYHSWIVDEASLPPELIATSRDADGHIMSFRHRSLPIWGVQFHPESIISGRWGRGLLARFISLSCRPDRRFAASSTHIFQ